MSVAPHSFFPTPPPPKPTHLYPMELLPFGPVYSLAMFTRKACSFRHAFEVRSFHDSFNPHLLVDSLRMTDLTSSREFCKVNAYPLAFLPFLHVTSLVKLAFFPHESYFSWLPKQMFHYKSFRVPPIWVPSTQHLKMLPQQWDPERI